MPKKQNVVFTPRDRKLFKYLRDFKIASVKQINRDIFEGTSNKVVYRRLQKLLITRAIKKNAVNHFNQIKGAYSLSKHCFNIIHPSKEDLRHEYNSKSPEHDLTLVDIFHAFITKKMVVDYIPENLLMIDKTNQFCDSLGDFYSMKPDAVVRVKLGNDEFNMAIEYESNMKTYKRYEMLIKRYYLKRNIGAVLFISRTREILTRVQSVDRKMSAKHSPKFFFSLLEDVLNNKEEMSFKTILNETLRIK